MVDAISSLERKNRGQPLCWVYIFGKEEVMEEVVTLDGMQHWVWKAT